MGTLLAAVCLLLLDAPECGNYSGSSVVAIMVASSRRGEIPVTVREIDRRVLLVQEGVEVGLIKLCVESDSPSNQTLQSSERRPRGLLCSFPTRSLTLRVVTENR